ncbi:MAG: efflux RND transporter permease subunit, partial [Candidatus Lindowbacteria bacterium]|nr:efflux RND transporter permease subunit [Candidatus Lindowbacteria bacterium]
RTFAILETLKGIPEVEHTYATIGAGDTGTVRDGVVYIKLVERGDRKRSQREIQRHVRRRLELIPGILPALAEIGRPETRRPLTISIRGDDIALLKQYAAALKEKIYHIPGIVDIDVTLEHDVPEYRLAIDQQRAYDAGVTTSHIVRTVGALLGGQAGSTYEDEDGDAVNVRVRLPAPLRQDLSNVQRLRLSVRRPGEGPALVPVGDLISYKIRPTPSEINRQDLMREVVISANLDNLPVGTATQKVKEVLPQIHMAPGYRVVFAGETERMEETFSSMTEALILSIILVYLILAAQFESFIDPLSIMLSLPFSLIGLAGMLLLTGDTLNMMSMIGLIMLMGLVTKNAILLVDCAKVLRSRGMERTEAIITAGRTRLRPILMTTLAMIFGMTPLALALGAGAEMRAPMARAVIGGLITSTILTLLIVPVMYSLLDDFGIRVRARWKAKKEPSAEVEM